MPIRCKIGDTMKKLLFLLCFLSTSALAIDRPIPCTGNSCKLLFETTGSGGAKVSAGQADGLGIWKLNAIALPAQFISSGSSATIQTGVSAVILTGISGGFTLTFPTSGNLVDGQLILISNQSAATITYAASGATFPGGSATAPGTNQGQMLIYRAANTSWYIVSRGS